MNLEDRVALLLGRAIMRAESLQIENEKLKELLAENDENKKDDNPKS